MYNVSTLCNFKTKIQTFKIENVHTNTVPMNSKNDSKIFQHVKKLCYSNKLHKGKMMKCKYTVHTFSNVS